MVPAQAQHSGTYEIDPARSELHWRVYSAGALSGLGHNHVIAARGISGRVQLAEPMQDSQFSLQIPLSSLVVDDPPLRSRYGKDFSSQPSAEDIAGTRENMLGAKLLNAASFPLLRIHGKGSAADGQMHVTLEIHGRNLPLTIPVKIQVSDKGITARGNFSLTHAQLGLRPFSAALGALKVAEKMDFTFNIRARRSY
jgi:polyisoprenoid-binding protein YceI